MSQITSLALAALLGIGVVGVSEPVSAADPESANPARAKLYAHTEGISGELSVRPAQNPAAKAQDAAPWAVTSPSGVHIPSRAGFVGYR
jgi:hypothetical protein